MVLVRDTDKLVKGPIRCKACHTKQAWVWPDGLCIDCKIIAEKVRTHEPIK